MKDPINDLTTCWSMHHQSFRKPSRYTSGVFLLCFLLFTHISVYAQQSPYFVQANIIYRFTKYINWPDEKKSGDFVIGIVGDTPLQDELKAFTSAKTAGGQRIVVKRFSSFANAFPCQILFVTEEESKNLKRIVKTTNEAPILLVTESEGLAQKGACINFIIVEDRLKLEINKSNIEHHDLDVASELLSLGTLIK